MPRKGRTDFLCLDCKVDTSKNYEYYMLRDDVWWSVHPSPFGMLCIGCVETRLGRTLTADDFHPCYLNGAAFSKSLRLADRLGILNECRIDS